MIIGNKGLGRDCIVSCPCGRSSSYVVHLCPAPSSSFKQYIGRPHEFLIPNVWRPLRHKTVRYSYGPCCFNILHFNLKHHLSHFTFLGCWKMRESNRKIFERYWTITSRYPVHSGRGGCLLPPHLMYSTGFSHTRGSIRGREWKAMHDMPSNIWICSWKWKLMKRHKLELFL